MPTHVLIRAALVTTALLVACGDDGPAGPGGAAGSGGGSTFPSVTSLTEPGPFVTQNPQGDAEGPNCTVHRPAILGENGLKHPVIIWGMGTGGFNLYQPAFDLWASNGFIVVGGLLGNGQGSGEEMLGCLDYICRQYAPNVDCRAGASGHSQGGGGALMAGRDPRVIVTAPVQPYIQQGFGGYDQASIDQQVGPMLLLSGTADNIATPSGNQQPVFDRTNVPVFWANKVGEDHVSVGTDGLISYRSEILAWFRIHLMDDDTFRPMFYGANCELCGDSTWMVKRDGIQ